MRVWGLFTKMQSEINRAREYRRPDRSGRSGRSDRYDWDNRDEYKRCSPAYVTIGCGSLTVVIIGCLILFNGMHADSDMNASSNIVTNPSFSNPGNMLPLPPNLPAWATNRHRFEDRHIHPNLVNFTYSPISVNKQYHNVRQTSLIESTEGGHQIAIDYDADITSVHIFSLDHELCVESVVCAEGYMTLGLNEQSCSVPLETGTIVVGSHHWNCTQSELDSRAESVVSTIQHKVVTVDVISQSETKISFKPAAISEILPTSKISIGHRQPSSCPVAGRRLSIFKKIGNAIAGDFKKSGSLDPKLPTKVIPVKPPSVPNQAIKVAEGAQAAMSMQAIEYGFETHHWRIEHIVIAMQLNADSSPDTQVNANSDSVQSDTPIFKETYTKGYHAEYDIFPEQGGSTRIWHVAFSVGPLPLTVSLDMDLKLTLDIGFEADADLIAKHTGHLSSDETNYMGVQYNRVANSKGPKGWSKLNPANSKSGERSVVVQPGLNAKMATSVLLDLGLSLSIAKVLVLPFRFGLGVNTEIDFHLNTDAECGSNSGYTVSMSRYLSLDLKAIIDLHIKVVHLHIQKTLQLISPTSDPKVILNKQHCEGTKLEHKEGEAQQCTASSSNN